MSSRPFAGKLEVDSTGHNIIAEGDGLTPFRVKNIGNETVYVSRVDRNDSTSTVNPVVAYPIYPGETLDGISNAGDEGDWCAGFNTNGSTSELRYLGTTTYT